MYYSTKLLNVAKVTSLITSVILLNACVSEDDDDVLTYSQHYAVVATQASDYSSGNISVISLTDYSRDNRNFAGGSDTVISTHGEDVYRIGRFGQDNVTKFSIDARKKVKWQYSANDDSDTSANPYKLVVKNDTTGYLIRYGSDKVWIVDPSATSYEAFKTGEIDLSAYGGIDGIPEVVDALLIDDHLYLLMQNFNREVEDGPWIVGQAYLAVYDTADNTEIDTNAGANAVLGIPLKAENPIKMQYLSTNNTIYIAANGPYYEVIPYTGGVEKVNLNDYSSEIIVDDGDADNHPYGTINNIAILNSTRGYFVAYFSWSDNAVFGFNPSTGEVDNEPLLSQKDISDIEIGPLGNLWITDRAASGITVINTVDESVLVELIDTDFVPVDIEFISREE